jgi:hypothetical protein
MQGYETLFWLEVGDEHKSKEEIVEITKIRLASAQISPKWVQKLAGMALGPLLPEVAAIAGLIAEAYYGGLPNLSIKLFCSTNPLLSSILKD